MINTSSIDSSNPQISIKQSNSINKGEKSTKQKAAELRKTCRDFQAIFLGYILKTMRRTISKSGLLGKGYGGEMFTDLFDTKLAEEISGDSKLGLDEMLFRQLAPAALGDSWKDAFSEDVIPQNAKMIKLLDGSNPVGDNYKNGEYSHIIREVAHKYNLSPKLLSAVIEVESSGDTKAVSPQGAKGLMQLADSTAAQMGVSDPFNPYQNINGGAKYLRLMLDKYKGNIALALAAYNAGPSSVDRYNGIPPYKETMDYVADILKRLNISYSRNSEEYSVKDIGKNADF